MGLRGLPETPEGRAGVTAPGRLGRDGRLLSRRSGRAMSTGCDGPACSSLDENWSAAF